MEILKCDYCGNKNTSILHRGYFVKGKNFEVVKCRHCGLIYTNPQPTKDEILSYYDEDYYGIKNMKFKGPIEKFIHVKRGIRAKRIEKFIRSGKILDIGCGRGLFLDEMRKRGYEAHGIEISETGARFAKEILKLNISVEPIELINFPGNHFDIVTLYHVLEHLPSPFHTLKEVRRILKPRGLLIVSVPNIESWQARIFRLYWFHFDIPRHFFHFSKQSLNKLLPPEHWGTLKVRRFSFEHGPFGWVQSLLNMVFGNDNILYNILKAKTAGTLGIYAKQRFRMFRWTLTLLNVILGALLTPFAIVLSLISSLTDYNEMMEVAYRKKL